MDCDDDGDLDVLASHEDGAILIAFRNSGDGTFAEVQSSDTFIVTWDMEAAEVTPNAQVLMGIGFPQRFVRMRRVPGQPCSFTQDGSYNLLSGGLKAIGVLDADGSATADVIVSSDDDGTGKPMQYAYDFSGDFPDFAVADSSATQPYAIAVGNVAGAGDDLVVTDLASRKVEVRQYYTGQGLLFPESGEVGNNPIGLVVGDINGDFRDDAITANEADGTVSILVNNGDEGFDKPDADLDITGGDPALGSPRDLVLADFDGDGDRDLAVVSSFDGMGKSFVTLFLNAGGGAFSPATTTQGGVTFPAEVGRQPWAIRAGDLNGDEIPDIVTSNHFDDGITSTVSILLSNP
ncbi:MAG: VCBS repeat-containing protein [Polyangiaceae bacterium]